MIVLVNTVPEVDEHITLPVARQVVGRMVRDIGMYDRVKDMIGVSLESMAAGGPQGIGVRPDLIRDRVDAKLTMNLNPKNNKFEGGEAIKLIDNMILMKRDHLPYEKLPYNPKANTSRYPIFHDARSSMTLVEDTIPCSFILDITFRMIDRNIASEAMSRLISVYTNGEMIMQPELLYDYPIPETILKVMLAGARMSGVADNQFIDWMKTGSGNKIAINTHRDDMTRNELIVNRNTFNAISQIEMSQESPVLNDQHFEFTFTITTQFARVNQLLLSYPVTICNQAVPMSLIPEQEEKKYIQDIKKTWESKAIDWYYKELYPDDDQFKAYHYPWWDHWDFPTSSFAFKRNHKLWLSCVFTLDDIENPNGVTRINITEIPNITISPEVLQWFQTNAAIALNYDSDYTIGVFADDLQVDPKLLEFDGTTITIKNRKITRVYRVVLSKQKGIEYGNYKSFRVAVVTIRTNRKS